jgi:hypothetical protein
MKFSPRDKLAWWTLSTLFLVIAILPARRVRDFNASPDVRAIHVSHHHDHHPTYLAAVSTSAYTQSLRLRDMDFIGMPGCMLKYS